MRFTSLPIGVLVLFFHLSSVLVTRLELTEKSKIGSTSVCPPPPVSFVLSVLFVFEKPVQPVDNGWFLYRGNAANPGIRFVRCVYRVKCLIRVVGTKKSD